VDHARGTHRDPGDHVMKNATQVLDYETFRAEAARVAEEASRDLAGYALLKELTDALPGVSSGGAFRERLARWVKEKRIRTVMYQRRPRYNMADFLVCWKEHVCPSSR
jgi:hypothetical protein